VKSAQFLQIQRKIVHFYVNKYSNRLIFQQITYEVTLSAVAISFIFNRLFHRLVCIKKSR
jgi:hypothetical protein